MRARDSFLGTGRVELPPRSPALWMPGLTRRDTHLPALIFLLLICVALLSALLAGYVMAKRKHRSALHMILVRRDYFRHDLCGAGFGRAAIGVDPAGPRGSDADRFARLDSIGAQRKINASPGGAHADCRIELELQRLKAALSLLARCRGLKPRPTKIPCLRQSSQIQTAPRPCDRGAVLLTGAVLTAPVG